MSLTKLILVQIINSFLTEELNWLSNPAYLEVQGALVQQALIRLRPADHQWAHAILIPIPLQLTIPYNKDNIILSPHTLLFT